MSGFMLSGVPTAETAVGAGVAAKARKCLRSELHRAGRSLIE